jgi:hypothetical protein
MPRAASTLCIAAAVLACWPGAAMASPGEVVRLQTLLASMHPDHGRYIRAVRAAPEGSGSELYLGLVSPGGGDVYRDAPLPGARRQYDLLVFPDDGPARSEAWSRVLLDHEYFHARHLGRGDRLPRPTFAKDAANRHFQEALAWGHNARKVLEGAYGELPEHRRREVLQHYRKHREAFARYVQRQQPSAWAYYVRFLPELDDEKQLERR